MSIKAKLISCITAFILVLGIMFAGVFAAEQVQVNIGGSVSFTATTVHAEISGNVQGSSTTNTLPTVTVDAETADGTLDMGDAWENMTLDFNEAGDDITVTINIKNLSSRPIYVNMNDTTNISNVQVIREVNNSTLSSALDSRAIEGLNTTLTYTFTLHLQSKDTSVSNGQFNVNISLANEEPEQVGQYTVTVSNNALNELMGQTTIYVKTDTSAIQTTNDGDTIELKGNSYVYFSIDLSALQSATNTLSLNSQSFNSYMLGEKELYARFPASGSINLQINGTRTDTYLSSESNNWGNGFEGSTEFNEYIEFLENYNVVAIRLTNNISIRFL